MNMIQVDHFKKTFFVGLRRKRFDAARDISFSVEKAEIFGFLGPNGAGKTTTIKAMLGLIRADSGLIRLLGHEPDSLQWQKDVGYMPEHPTFYEYLTPLEMVAWFGQLSGLARHEAETRAKRQLERVGLGHVLDRRLRKFSKGMLQRAGLAQAMVAAPKLLILDEPMTGLDPIGRKDLRELILELRHEGATIFYSTHILPDVEMTCDRVSIIHRGETRRTGRLEDILTETTRGVSVVLGNLDGVHLERIKTAHPGATIADGAIHVEFDQLAPAQTFASAMMAEGAMLVRFEPHRDDLEAIFVRSLGENATEAGLS